MLRWAVALSLILVGGSTQGHAALSQPDAIYYGSALLNGRSAPGGTVVTARVGGSLLDSYTIGADPSAGDLYALVIPISQPTENGQTQAASARDGDAVQIFIDEQLAVEVELRSGTFTRQDLSRGVLLCAGGSADGEDCAFDSDCPGGICVVAQAVCEGGGDDGLRCECIGGICSDDVACTANLAMGTCNQGELVGECCEPSMNCADGATCGGTQKICLGGSRRGFPCTRDAHCPDSSCGTTSTLCNGGDQQGVACVDDRDCSGGSCGAPIPTPTRTATPTRTPTRVQTGVATVTRIPTVTRTPGPCVGDCDDSMRVTIDELVTMVNQALGVAPISACLLADGNGDAEVTIDEAIDGVNNALLGCSP